MDEQAKKAKRRSKTESLERPPAKPGPRNGLGRPPSSVGEGNVSGSKGGLDANDKATKRRL